MPHDAATSATYIRVASTSIAAYDYFRTLPAAWRFYEAHWNNRTLSARVLEISPSVMSVAVLVLSNVGFFYSDFTLESCQAFYLVPPVFKVFQAMVSQSIMGVRTFNLARRSARVGYFLLALYLASSTVRRFLVSIRSNPRPKRFTSALSPSCLATNLDGHHLGAWVYYAVCIIYDLITTVISVWFLLKYKFTLSNHSV
ncbi:hypothetical protein BV22DRAFT_1010253 [Leucogyrophana mollusca]|uniref:Uncharacterized protein n=1 Tax=Leucogyrophana mollusca TaxID=85980 RepID=A0ACB8BJ78_9AGAM|nr:hypothetical protein BV22DRAFT_1010253 [Leucogyrophana mollusca]